MRKEKKKTKSAGGIVLPDSAVEADSYMQVTAEVVAIGPCAYMDRATGEPWLSGPWCKVGDWVIRPKFSQMTFELDGEDYFFMNDDEVVATIKDPKSIKVFL